MNEATQSQWLPGQPVRTPADVAQWEAWKTMRIRESQRFRRSLYRRIDYYPSKEALDLIDSYLNGRRSYAHIIDALVLGEAPE